MLTEPEIEEENQTAAPPRPVITASVTNEGVEALDLKVGTPATAVFKAYAVMVAAQP